MRILVYGINYAPELIGIGKVTGEMCEWLAQGGHEVRVISAPPYYPDWRVQEGHRGSRYRNEKLNGVTVIRCPLWVPARPSGLKRVLHLASFALSSLPAVLGQFRWRPDVVLVIEPALMCAPAVLLLSSLVGAKSWLHVQDFEVDAAFQLGLLPPFLERIAVGLEKALKMQFDRVSTISGKMLARLVAKDVRAERRVFFPNWVDCKRIFPQPGKSPLRAELDIPETATVALYSGNMGEKQDIGLILDAAAKLAHRDDLAFVMCGMGAAYGRLKARAEERGLDNVRWLPLQPAARLNDLLNLADVHLLPQGADSEDLVMPSKLTGMLASGRAVLGTARAGTDLARVLAQVGEVTEPGDADAFAAALHRLAADDARRRVLGILARQFAEENLDKELLLGNFERDLRLCVELA